MCNNTTCYECNQPPLCHQNDCSCPVKDLSTDCVLYTGNDLRCSGIKSQTILTELIQQLDDFICTLIQQTSSGVTLINIGNGLEVYRGTTITGAKELRTIKAIGDFIEVSVSQSGEEIEIKETPIEALKKIQISFDWKDEDNFREIKVKEDMPRKVTDSWYRRNGFIGHIKPYKSPANQVLHPQFNYGLGLVDPILIEVDVFNLGIKIKDFDKIKDYSPVVVISKYTPTKKHHTNNPNPIPNTSNPIHYFPNTTYKKGSFKFSEDSDTVRLTRVPIQASYQVIDFGQEHYFRTSKSFQQARALGGGKFEFILETRGTKKRYSQCRVPYLVGVAGFIGKDFTTSSAFVYLNFHIEIEVEGKKYISEPLGKLKMVASIDTPGRGTKVLEPGDIVPYNYMTKYGTNTRAKIRYKHT